MNWDEILDEQAKDAGFAPAPPGKYPCLVEKAEAVKAGTGADMIKLELKIIGGPYDTKKVWTNIVFSTGNPTAMRFTLRKLAGLGVTREVLSAQNPTPAQIAAMVTGRMTEAEIEVRDYNDEKRNDVKALRKLDGEAPAAPAASAPAPSAGGGMVPSIPATAAAPSVPTPPPAPAVDADEDEEEPF